MRMAQKKVWAHRLYRVAIRHRYLSLANIVSTVWRCRKRVLPKGVECLRLFAGGMRGAMPRRAEERRAARLAANSKGQFADDVARVADIARLRCQPLLGRLPEADVMGGHAADAAPVAIGELPEPRPVETRVSRAVPDGLPWPGSPWMIRMPGSEPAHSRRLNLVLASADRRPGRGDVLVGVTARTAAAACSGADGAHASPARRSRPTTTASPRHRDVRECPCLRARRSGRPGSASRSRPAP